MGHNDQKEKGEGVGAFTTYKESLKQFIAQARRKGVTPDSGDADESQDVRRRRQGHEQPGRLSRGGAAGGAEEKVAVIDLNAMSKLFYEALGPEGRGQGLRRRRHHAPQQLRQLRAGALHRAGHPRRQARPRWVSGRRRPRFDPSHPDPPATFAIPAEPRGGVQKPYGN